MTPTKQTVYLPEDPKDCDYTVLWYDDSYENHVKKEEGYFFTPEQLNEYTQTVIKQTLDTAAEKVDLIETDGDPDPGSITNTFEETFKKFEV